MTDDVTGEDDEVDVVELERRLDYVQEKARGLERAMLLLAITQTVVISLFVYLLVRASG